MSTLQAPSSDPPPSGTHPTMPRGHAAPLHYFFALRPRHADAERLAHEVARRVRAEGLTGRAFEAARLHVTLEFLGRVDDPLLLAAACRAAERLHEDAVDVVFERALSFDTPSRPFVLTGAACLDPVRHIRQALAMALADEGFHPRRSYTPHMTLCYDRAHKVAEHTVAPLSFHASAIDFMVSHVGQSRHERVASWPLAMKSH